MFLDGHVKPESGWWEAMLRRTSNTYKRVVVPLIPTLDGDAWEPNNNAVGVTMMLDWSRTSSGSRTTTTSCRA